MRAQEEEREDNLTQTLRAAEARVFELEKRVSALQSALACAMEARVLTDDEAGALNASAGYDEIFVDTLRGALLRMGIMPKKKADE
jgi:hypothetical protein